jgi:hypothetical protein
MDRRSIIEQVLSGLKVAAVGIFGIATIGMFWGGITVLTTPGRVASWSFLFHRISVGGHSIIAGWVCLVISAAILILTMDRWVNILPGILAYSTFGGLVMLAGGRYNGIPVPWQAALFLVVFGIATTLVSFSFCKRKLSVIDRIVLMAFQACMPLSATTDVSIMYKALSAGFSLLIVGWIVNRFQHHRPATHRPDQLHNPTLTGKR